MGQYTTPIYALPYCDDDEPAREWPGLQKRVSERIEQAFSDAQVPPGNPDVNAILRRLNQIGSISTYIATGSKPNFAPSDQVIATPSYVPDQSTANQAGTSAGSLLVSEAGVYAVGYQLEMFKDSGMTQGAPATGRTFIDITDNSGFALVRTSCNVNEDQASSAMPGKRFRAGERVTFKFLQTTGAVAYYRATIRLIRLA